MRLRLGLLLLATCWVCVGSATAQRAHTTPPAADDFGPVVRAYLGYLQAEQEVVDDRASRREISPVYYRRNSNRIRALRQIALRLARESHNDYLPELEAVAVDELGTLFDLPPRPQEFHVGEVLDNTFRYLGAVRAGDTFYVFARLDPYEQAELLKQQEQRPTTGAQTATTPPMSTAQPGPANTRARRVSPP